MSLRERIAALSPEKRALLERRLERVAPANDRIPRRGEYGGPLPLSFAQQRLWVLEEIEPGHSFYNLPLAMPLNGPLNVVVLERALNEIVRRHESLRTTFVAVDGRPSQMIAPQLRVPIEIVEEDDVQRPFDLSAGPLLRASLDRRQVLVLTMHHIISDGWSLGVLYRELAALYEAYVSGRPSPLPELPIQYADFAIWQRATLHGPALDRLLSYWKSKLGGMPPLMELPLDHPRPRVQVFRGAALEVPMPKELTQSLNAIARQSGATLFMVLLAAFKILLARYTGRTDIVVGSPIANRTRRETEGLIGFFVNTLVLRSDLSGDPTFLEALARVREVTLEAFAHQDLPFDKLVEELQPPRDLSHNPLFQVAFALQNTESPSAPGGRASHTGGGTSKFDLTVAAIETSSGLRVAFEYNTELFERQTIETFAAHYQTILESAAGAPEKQISRMLESRGEASVGAVIDIPAITMPELLEEQARIRPDAIAVTFAGESVTWQGLNERVNQMAHALRDRGVKRGSIVAIDLPRSLDLPVAQLAVWKAGAAFVPIDPSYPKERIDFIVEETGAARPPGSLADASNDTTVTPSESEGSGCAGGAKMPLPRAARSSRPLAPARGDNDVMPIAIVAPPRSPARDDNVGEYPAPDDLAYVIYTSGSTGKPKGVMVPHRGLANVVAAQSHVFALDSEARILQFSSSTFDASIFELLLALHSGGTLCLAPQDALMPGTPLLQTLRDERISVIVIPPSSLAMLPAAALPDLTTIIAAGEELPPDLIARWASGRRFFNAYGPTETTIWATVAECRDPSDVVTIGRAIPNVQVYVLAPSGVPGEIAIGGVGVADGYLNRPALTVEKFVRGRYLTGDRGRMLANGEIQYLGRIDQQLKLRGYRIEPGEIEAVLLAHPNVRDVVIVAQRAALTAFCTGESLDTASLRSFARKSLPDYMMPSRFVVLDALPLTSSGKADRNALAAMTPAVETVEETARSPEEKQVSDIWAEVLELPAVGIHDRFFDLGGHSLLATRAVSRVNEAFGLSLPLRTIFEKPSVAEFTEAITLAREVTP